MTRCHGNKITLKNRFQVVFSSKMCQNCKIMESSSYLLEPLNFRLSINT